MAGAIERIERDLAALREALATLAAEFHSTYSNYLTVLGQAVRQQLILASYQICTQGYPESLLKLSFTERQDLQTSLRRLRQQAQEQLLSLVLASPNSSNHPADFAAAYGSNRPVSVDATAGLTNPEQLAQWQENLEMALSRTLQTLSHSTNLTLQQAGILPRQLPEGVLEAASKAEGSAERVAGTPNLLNLLIETENSQDAEGSKVTHIIALHLRLSEIEFAEPTVMARRNQIRHLSSRLNTLRKEYQRKQRERIIAQAEVAWRSSWFED